MSYVIYEDSPTFVIPGGATSSVIASFSFPNRERTLGIRMFICFRSSGETAAVAYIQNSFEQDSTGNILEIGSPTKQIDKGVNAADWDIFLETDPFNPTNEIRVRWTGTVASDVAATFNGFCSFAGPPLL